MYVASRFHEGYVGLRKWQEKGCPHCEAKVAKVIAVIGGKETMRRCNECYTVFIVRQCDDEE